jgi:hypothetical protein
VRSHVPKPTIKIEDILDDNVLSKHLAECKICRRIMERINRECALVRNLYERRN